MNPASVGFFCLSGGRDDQNETTEL